MKTYRLDHSHLVLVGSLPALGVRAVSVAVLAVVVVLPEQLVGVRLDLGDRCIEAGNMFFEERCNSLANQGWRHVDEARLVSLFLLGSPSITVELLESWEVEVTWFYFTVLGVGWARGEM